MRGSLALMLCAWHVYERLIACGTIERFHKRNTARVSKVCFFEFDSDWFASVRKWVCSCQCMEFTADCLYL